MTRKHFEAIAAMIRDARAAAHGGQGLGYASGFAAGADSAREYIAVQFCEYARECNPNFDAQRFLSACEVD